MALALDEMQQQNSSLDVDNARLKVELVSLPMGLETWHAQRCQCGMSLCACRAVLCLACHLQLLMSVRVCAGGNFRPPGTFSAARVSLLAAWHHQARQLDATGAGSDLICLLPAELCEAGADNHQRGAPDCPGPA